MPFTIQSPKCLFMSTINVKWTWNFCCDSSKPSKPFFELPGTFILRIFFTMDRFPWCPPSFKSSSNIYKISVKMLKPRNLSHLSPVLLYWYVTALEIWRNPITGHMWVTLDNIQWNGNCEIMKALLNFFTCYE